MPVYMIIDVHVLEPVRYAEYTERAAKIVAQYGGRYLVCGGEILSHSDSWNPERIVVIEFSTLADQQACFNSAEYRQIAPLREQSTSGKSIVVEGYE